MLLCHDLISLNISMPFISIFPFDGFIRPKIKSINVVLPDPLSPITPIILPKSI